MFYRSSITAAALLGALCVTTVDTRAWDDTKYPDFNGQWGAIGGLGDLTSTSLPVTDNRPR